MVYIPQDVESAVRNRCHRLRHSPRTADSYYYWIERFILWTGKELRYTSKKDVREFLESLDKKNLAGSTINQAHMALKFLFEDVMDKKMWINIRYAKTPNKIQRFLTKEEVKRLMANISNWKHRLIVQLMYGAGLRVSEVRNMKVCELVNRSEGYGFVRNGKGGKDRLMIIHPIIAEKIDNLIKIEELGEKDYLFTSNRGEKYSIRTFQKIVKDAAKGAGIRDWKEVHPHTLRHTFATHLIENDYTLSDVQATLGHKSPETSMIYTHNNKGKMISTKSPLFT
jgi:integrase/recombinase XerD